MRKEACKTRDNITRYTPETRRNKNIVNYAGFKKEWAIINKRSPAVLKETIPNLLENMNKSIIFISFLTYSFSGYAGEVLNINDI